MDFITPQLPTLLDYRKHNFEFVVTALGMKYVNIGGTEFEVYSINSRSELPNRGSAVIASTNEPLSSVIQNVWDCKTDLRLEFDRYFCQFSGPPNWQEINSLVGIITVRWHLKSEGADPAKKEAVYCNAPRDVLETIGVNPAESVKCRTEDRAGRGASSTVNAIDQRFVYRSTAVAHPCLIIDSWSNVAELALVSGTANYNAFFKEDTLVVRQVLESGRLDRLHRKAFLRKYLELWKCFASLIDGIAFPLRSSVFQNSWTVFMEGNMGPGDLDINGPSIKG